MYCPNCGSKCEDNHRFCPYCGTPLPLAAPIELPAQDSPEPPVIEEPKTCEADEPISMVMADTASAVESSAESCPRQKGRLWPPALLMAVMVCVGLLVFFLTSGHSGTDPNMPWFQVKEGVLYFDATLYPGGSELTIPETIGGQTVTALSEGCFAQCDRLTTVILPDTLTEIGPWAFTMCSSMRGIYIPDSVNTIGTQAFSGCTALEAIYIPGTVATIEQQAFLSCQKLHYIFFSGPYQQWAVLYTDRIAVDTYIYCNDGIYQHTGRP